METINGLMLWSAGREGLADSITVNELKSVHPAWARVVADCTAWVEQGDFTVCSTTAETPAPVCICGPCGSSLDVAWALVEQGALSEWGAVLAVSQRSGRGQLRRDWISPAGNLYAAWLWPELPQAFAPLVSLVAGGVVAETLKELGMAVHIKWPNDLLLENGRKVGGILVEERFGKTLVGIGLNLDSSPQDSEIRESWSPRAGIMSPLGDEKNVISLWCGLVKSARCWYEAHASSENPQNFLDWLESRIAWLGLNVRVRSSQGEFVAVPVGLAADGGLVLRRGNQTEILYSGSIALE
ncbi:biotin--[acetyl-CoA-carboxylase] ligase [Desulfovibrio ferrophilus]|uniref:biotin--[biotin carboxyl-carrier protein] ligase n=1 Tax=Desulfovibrio ferrophilus TaxID=241368 RepID=A0A2Z6AX39_9BACT|nr:biotin--[acetyl-CoA-carboxylase] ligase [Desulfovibrio ferrophilus]BBD07822.1 BirA, biotin-(Acetyl-CoA-carboxylase) ligase [Desulfovibrio ferrophilus]